MIIKDFRTIRSFICLEGSDLQLLNSTDKPLDFPHLIFGVKNGNVSTYQATNTTTDMPFFAYDIPCYLDAYQPKGSSVLAALKTLDVIANSSVLKWLKSGWISIVKIGDTNYFKFSMEDDVGFSSDSTYPKNFPICSKLNRILDKQSVDMTAILDTDLNLMMGIQSLLDFKYAFDLLETNKKWDILSHVESWKLNESMREFALLIYNQHSLDLSRSLSGKYFGIDSEKVRIQRVRNCLVIAPYDGPKHHEHDYIKFVDEIEYMEA